MTTKTRPRRASSTAAPAAVRLLGRLVVTLAAESALLFAAAYHLRGDAATAILGPNATPESVAVLRRELGLDDNIVVQYGRWIGNALRGDLGVSARSGQPVTRVIADPLTASLILAGVSGLLIAALALLIGTAAGTRPGSRLDHAVSALTVLIVSVPAFVTATLASVVFAGVLGWLPAASLVPVGGTPLDRPEILVLPALSLVLVGTAWAARLVRAAVADATVAPNVVAARLAGLPESRVLLRHLLPLAAAPCAQVLAWLSTLLIGGTVVVEQVFAYPGLGRVLVGAARDHDTAVLEGVGLIMVAAVTIAFAAADAVPLLTDPRHRTEPS